MPLDINNLPDMSNGLIGPEALQPLINTIQPFLFKLSLILGGIFGLYLILVLVRIYFERKKVKVLKDIRYDLDNLNIHYGVPCSRERKGLWSRLFGFLGSLFCRKKTPEKKQKKPKHEN